jgi:uncharacterized membrane protein YraQ (UPF0718 family)
LSLIGKLDRVWLALAALLAILALADPGQAGESVLFMTNSFLWIAPFLLLSVLLAAWLKAAGVDRLVGRVGARAPAAAILLAALFGALSPFCSCGVVPLVAALLVVGVPLPAVMAFWVSSPLMDPEQFILMAATLGLGFTLAKTIAAVAMGLLAGLATLAVQRAGGFGEPLRAGLGKGCKSGVSEAAELRWAIWRDAARRRDFTVEALRVAEFLAKWLLLAFAIESLMVAWLPPDLIATHLGGSGWQAIAEPAGRLRRLALKPIPVFIGVDVRRLVAQNGLAQKGIVDIAKVEPAVEQVEPIHLFGEPASHFMVGRRVESVGVDLCRQNGKILERPAGFIAGGFDDGAKAVLHHLPPSITMIPGSAGK